ncbi:MAG: sensor histidine kinase [Vitreimonas sp.]
MTYYAGSEASKPGDGPQQTPLEHLNAIELRDALKQASVEMLQSEDRERRRIATELHDSTGQHLAGAAMILSRIEKRAPHDVDRSLHEARDAVDAALEEIRTLSYVLHPPQLARDGLPATLQTLASGFARRSGLKVQFACGGVARPLEPAIELALFRVAQEGLLNAHKHARASAATLRLKYGPFGVRLEISDDGEVVGEARTLTSGVGLSSMRARMRELGGRLEVARRGAGLVVIATAPIADSPPAAERDERRSRALRAWRGLTDAPRSAQGERLGPSGM